MSKGKKSDYKVKEEYIVNMKKYIESLTKNKETKKDSNNDSEHK